MGGGRLPHHHHQTPPVRRPGRPAHTVHARACPRVHAAPHASGGLWGEQRTRARVRARLSFSLQPSLHCLFLTPSSAPPSPSARTAFRPPPMQPAPPRLMRALRPVIRVRTRSSPRALARPVGRAAKGSSAPEDPRVRLTGRAWRRVGWGRAWGRQGLVRRWWAVGRRSPCGRRPPSYPSLSTSHPPLPRPPPRPPPPPPHPPHPDRSRPAGRPDLLSDRLHHHFRQRQQPGRLRDHVRCGHVRAVQLRSVRAVRFRRDLPRCDEKKKKKKGSRRGGRWWKGLGGRSRPPPCGPGSSPTRPCGRRPWSGGLAR